MPLKPSYTLSYTVISLCQAPAMIKKESLAEPADLPVPPARAPAPAQVGGLVAAAESEFRRRDTSELQAWFVWIGSVWFQVYIFGFVDY